MQNFKDESFISQYLSPKVIRDLKLFTLDDDENKPYLKVKAIHDDHGYQQVREALSAQYNLSNIEPNIQVYNVNLRGDRSLTLRYVPHQGIPLGKSKEEVIKHLHRLWGFDVILEQSDDNGGVQEIARCPAQD
jgi:spore cortex formation protein SpoVR/YcgB (stage V sporulation)